MVRAETLHTGRELDQMVECMIFGHDVEWSPWGGFLEIFRKGVRDFGMPVVVPRYSRDMSDAWALVERMRSDGFSFKIWQPGIMPGWNGPKAPEHAVVSFVCSLGPCERHKTSHCNHHGAYDIEGETAPLAISRAALVALKFASAHPQEGDKV